MLLPFDGELDLAPQKRFEETVVFVHHFGGSARTVARHSRLLNKIGFDTVRFNLLCNGEKTGRRLPATRSFKLGIGHVWTEQIEHMLDLVPGPKVLYSFSMPTNSALEAIANRRARDIKALICDGGPFYELPRCVWNLYTHEYRLESRILRGIYTGVSLAIYGMDLAFRLPAKLKQIPPRFPILSIRGEEDPLVPPGAIDKVFVSQNQLDIKRLAFEKGRHLDGLKNFPDLYAATVTRFLEEVLKTRSTTGSPR